MARQVLENGVVLPAEYSDDWYDDMTSNLTKLDDVIGSDSEKLSSADVGAAALSNNYNDLDNLPTIPTKTSDLTNDSNFVDTSNSAVASGITSAKVTSYDSHIADTDKHVTTADKTKWNNGVSQSYVLRYSSSSVTDNSTIAYSTLDNTDNIKSGDKVIDVDGKIFSVVSVDTANQTVTVSSALIDLALDANVVHTSGNETVGGKKTFRDDLTIYNYDSSQSTKNLNINSSKIHVGDTSNSDAFGIRLNAGASYVAQILAVNDTTGTQNLQLGLRTKDGSDNFITSMVRSRLSANGNSSFEPGANDSISLGSSSFNWKSVYATNYYYGANNVEFSTKFVTTDTAQTITGNKTFSSINSVEPSSLSLPSGNVSDVIDISSYITALDGTDNTYIAPANGWITINMNNCLGIHATITGSWSDSRVRASAGAVKFLMPVLKNQTVTLTIHGGTINNARFIPCQGNV